MSNDPIPYASREHRSITARDIFGIIVRTVGLGFAIYGAYCVFYGVTVQTVPGTPTNGTSVGTFLGFGAVWFALGLAFLKGEWIVRFAYGREQ